MAELLRAVLCSVAALVLLVNSNQRTLRHLEERLSEQGYLVAAVGAFKDAAALLQSARPDLLIVDLRLEAYNGLHLAMRAQRDHPDVPVIVTHVDNDSITETEARRYNAVFIARPLENPTFLQAVRMALERRWSAHQPIRRWPRQPLSHPVSAQVLDARGFLLDVSYGGVRVSFSDTDEIPEIFEISVPSAGVSVRAERIWTNHPSGQALVCGAVLTDTPPSSWHQFVDALTADSQAD